jgi:hypothetical protein
MKSVGLLKALLTLQLSGFMLILNWVAMQNRLATIAIFLETSRKITLVRRNFSSQTEEASVQ